MPQMTHSFISDSSCSLQVENLVQRVGDFTLEAHFSVERNERIALLGRSGSGKTTLLRMIAGLHSLQVSQGDGLGGKIVLGKKEISALPPQKRNVGYVFQDHALFPHLSVLENAAFGLRMRGVPERQRNQEALSWLERVGLQKKTTCS